MYGIAQLAYQRDELGQPGMQAFVEDFLDAGVAQARVYFRRQALGRTAVSARQLGEDLVDFLGAGAQRTGDIGAQKQQLGDLTGTGRVAVDFGVGLE